MRSSIESIMSAMATSLKFEGGERVEGGCWVDECYPNRACDHSKVLHNNIHLVHKSNSSRKLMGNSWRVDDLTFKGIQVVPMI